ncbi:MAG: hypothetical protein H6624_14200 [Bdellovibrionaceae bacterium]|nr:hypothetical protein [Bdellovibrionales bacterium]MCB9085494.1 hypothetical protein [Pseudobdellovibrionaceae bacterium]
MSGDHKGPKPDLITSSKEYFDEAVGTALQERRVQASVPARSYLVDLLDFYLQTENLFEESPETGKKKSSTLAEMYLTAVNSEPSLKVEMLKRLGDMSLYISGFFGESLKRKIVDIDYYADIGGSAYGSLASMTAIDEVAEVYHDFSHRFLEYVDVLTCISEKSFVVSQADLLRLYDRYVLTGSKQAQDELNAKGLVAPTPYAKKVIRQ